MTITGSVDESGVTAAESRSDRPGFAAGVGVVSSLGRKGLMLVFSVLFVRLIGAELYGLFVAFETVMRPLGIVGAVGGVHVLVKEVGEARGRGDEERAGAVVLSGLALVLTVSTLLSLILWQGAGTIAGWLGDLAHLDTLIRWGCWYVVLVALTSSIPGALTGYGRTTRTFLLTNTFDPLAKLLGLGILAGLLAWTPGPWRWVPVPHAFSMVVLILLLWVLLRREPGLSNPRPSDFVREIRPVARVGLPLLAHGLVGIAFAYTDRAMIAGITGDAFGLGVYSVVILLGTLISLFHKNIVTAVSPAVSEAVGAANLERVRELYRGSSWASYIMAATGYLLLVLFSREVLALYDPRFADYGLVLAVVGWGFLFDTFAGCGGYLLIARGKSHYLMYNSVATILVNIILNFVLISRYGLVGAAAATAISYLIKNGFIVLENYLLDRTHPFSLMHVASLLLTVLAGAWIWRSTGTLSLPARMGVAAVVLAGGAAMLGLTFRDRVARLLGRL